MVGHHLRPIDRIRAEVIALRAEIGSRGLDDQEVELLVNPGLRSPKRKLRLYNHWGGYGYACGRWMHSEQDVEVQAAIEHDFVSHVMQAIGRLRAALRPAHLPPARVLILCNEPVANLKIDKLTTVKKLGADLLSTHSTVLSSEVGTNSPKAEDFIENTYMETPSNPPLVWAARVEEPGLHFSTPNRLEGWDEDLIQDETVETQFFDPWEEDLPSQQAGKAFCLKKRD